MSINTNNDKKLYKKNEQINVGSIQNFYKNSTILVTGSTGFVGKVLIEKLLRSCTSINTIIILIRSKRGQNYKTRYQNLLKDAVFDRLNNENPNLLQKLFCISGDVSQENFGLSNENLEKILNNVNIVFHCAATVKFNETLKEATNLNIFATYRLMEICSKMKNLKSVVHVSTAYVCPHRKDIGERVFLLPSPLNDVNLIQLIKTLPQEVLCSLLEKIQKFHPNTYTLTKSVAELVLLDYAKKFPLCIVRPSIITGAANEPFSGWVDNLQGLTGIIMEVGLGMIRNIDGDPNLIIDIIPVDIVVKTLITAAWSIGNQKTYSLKVYNCTSGQINPLFWSKIGYYVKKWTRLYPSKHVMLYPNYRMSLNKFINKYYQLVFHLFPAYVYDFLASLQGSKTFATKIAKKFVQACENGHFVTVNEWIFENKNLLQLIREIQTSEDGEEFLFDLVGLDYDNYIRDFILGIRKYILKDNEETLPDARKKLKRLYFVELFIESFLVLLGLYTVYGILN